LGSRADAWLALMDQKACLLASRQAFWWERNPAWRATCGQRTRPWRIASKVARAVGTKPKKPSSLAQP